MKPTQILQRICKENKLESPHYFQDRVVIGRYCMTFSPEEVLEWNGPTTCRNRDEHLALAVLHRWSEIPRVGCKVCANSLIQIVYSTLTQNMYLSAN